MREPHLTTTKRLSIFMQSVQKGVCSNQQTGAHNYHSLWSARLFYNISIRMGEPVKEKPLNERNRLMPMPNDQSDGLRLRTVKLLFKRGIDRYLGWYPTFGCCGRSNILGMCDAIHKISVKPRQDSLLRTLFFSLVQYLFYGHMLSSLLVVREII
jgi:hypothetical protein